MKKQTIEELKTEIETRRKNLDAYNAESEQISRMASEQISNLWNNFTASFKIEGDNNES